MTERTDVARDDAALDEAIVRLDVADTTLSPQQQARRDALLERIVAESAHAADDPASRRQAFAATPGGARRGRPRRRAVRIARWVGGDGLRARGRAGADVVSVTIHVDGRTLRVPVTDGSFTAQWPAASSAPSASSASSAAGEAPRFDLHLRDGSVLTDQRPVGGR